MFDVEVLIIICGRFWNVLRPPVSVVSGHSGVSANMMKKKNSHK